MRRPDGTWIKPPPPYSPIATSCKFIIFSYKLNTYVYSVYRVFTHVTQSCYIDLSFVCSIAFIYLFMNS